MKALRALRALGLAVISFTILTTCKPIAYYLEQVYKVYGKVTVEGTDPPTPIGSVEVFVGDYQYSELTNYYGDYEMEMAAGTWTLHFVKEGYKPTTAQVTVGPNNPRVQVDAKMVCNLTGYWDWYAVPAQGQPEMGPFIMYIKQDGSTLDAGYRKKGGHFTGKIDGMKFTLEGDVGGGTILTFSGEVFGEELKGTVISPYGQGTFRMVHSTLPFGEFKIEKGYCKGKTISLPSDDYGLAKKGEKVSNTTPFYVWFSDNRLWIEMEFNVAGDLGVGEYPIPNMAQVKLHWQYLSDEGKEDLSGLGDSSGKLIISSYDTNGISGNFDATSPGGDYVKGSFKVSFVEGF